MHTTTFSLPLILLLIITSPIATALPTSPSGNPPSLFCFSFFPILTTPAPRAAATCKQFQIFKSSSTGSGLRGHPVCCCVNQFCHPTDGPDGISAGATLNKFLGGMFSIRDQAGNMGVGSLDSGGATYTVASVNGC
ncbi:hypothetical protein K440DRAFT_670661 [Wilcoxina mikolae CBS 423.85]|nr:hypothetical protein K440DRAFT_670661 [Wilcoxina mikolae CBS 423.85]